MKKRILPFIITVLLCFSISFSVLASSATEATTAKSEKHPSRVVDLADLLSDSEEKSLLKKLNEISKKCESDVVVVTTDSVDGKTDEEYADDYFDYNGYGLGDDRDGVLLLIDMDERGWWISTRGFMTINIFSDYELSMIEDEIIPYLSSGDYYGGFDAFADYSENLFESSKVDLTDYAVRIFDEAGIISDKTEEELSETLNTISFYSCCDVVIATVESTSGQSIESYADDFFAKNYNSDIVSGIFLLFDSGKNRHILRTYGNVSDVLSENDLENIESSFSDNDFDEAFLAFADSVKLNILGMNFSDDYDGYTDSDINNYYGNKYFDPVWVAISLFAGIAIAFVIVTIIKGKLKSVRMNDSAADYVVNNSLRITQSEDVYLYSHVDRHERPKNTTNGGGMGGGGFGGGSSVHVSSSGASHGGSGGHF